MSFNIMCEILEELKVFLLCKRAAVYLNLVVVVCISSLQTGVYTVYAMFTVPNHWFLRVTF